MNLKSQINNNNEYERKLGGFRPHFQGKPDSYYQLSTKDILSALSVCVLIIAAFLFMSVGFFFWSKNVSTQSLVLVWSIILCIFIPFFAIMAYLRSRGKIEIEERLIKEALQRLVIEKEKRNKMRRDERHDDTEFDIMHKPRQNQTLMQLVER